MEEKSFRFPIDWVEPAHPAVVKLYEDLVSIYTLIRDRYQKGIDAAFDKVSRQIGFVVTTTIPIVFVCGEKGLIENINMGSEHLKDTLFDHELSAVLKPLIRGNHDLVTRVAAGTYNLYVLWYEALSLKLRTEWMEPAHLSTRSHAIEVQSARPTLFQGVTPRRGGCPWCEPAHWFDPGIAMAVEDAIQIEAIDKVYPELRLVDRIAAIRAMQRVRPGPGITEPAHPPTAASEE